MRILHISDTHGLPPEPIDKDFDIVVHSGDFMPNRTFGQRLIEEPFQKYWLETNAPRISPLYKTKPFLVVPGNHDYIDAVPILRAAGFDARFLADTHLEVEGVTFYGHPWTPEFCGWNWMCKRTEMALRLQSFAELANQGAVDVLVTHGPMYGVLDRNQDGERCGCPVLKRAIQDARHSPKALLHGHIHEAKGLMTWSRGMRISNAACTQRIVEV